MIEVQETFNDKQYSKEPKIKNVSPCYTGGNFYLYYGALVDGTYFIAGTPDFFITIVDSDPRLTANENNGGTLDADYADWQENHLIRYIDDNTDENINFFNTMFNWIIDNKPNDEWSNYSLDDMYDLLDENLNRV